MLTKELLDATLTASLSYTATLTGKTRDRAVFDYLCGAVYAYQASGILETNCPPWLWVIGVRGGDRVKTITNMLGIE